MFTLRCTQKILKRLKAKPSPNPPPNTTVLGDWYLDVIHHNRRPTFLFVNDPSRLALIMRASPQKTFQDRFLAELEAQFHHAQIPQEHIRIELGEMRGAQNMTLAKTANRSVLGTMLDYRNAISGSQEDERSCSQFLARIIGSPINYKHPKDVARSLFSTELIVH